MYRLLSIFLLLQSSCAVQFNKDFDKTSRHGKVMLIKTKYKDPDSEGRISKGHVLFRPNSLDDDLMPHDNLDLLSFQQNSAFNGALFSTFDMQRSKRSANDDIINNVRTKKLASKLCKNKPNCLEPTETLAYSQVESQIKPISIKDYPYEISVLINNDFVTKLELEKNKMAGLNGNNGISFTVFPLTPPTDLMRDDKLTTTYLSNRRAYGTNFETGNNFPLGNDQNLTSIFNTSTPKRSHFIPDIEIIRNLNMNDEIKMREDSTQATTDINDSMGWQPNMALPLPSMKSMYKLSAINNLPQTVETTTPKSIEIMKSINEKGLIKILVMLTNAFKKVMRQHEDIKRIYKKFSQANSKLTENTAYMVEKIQDFEAKYNYLLDYNHKIEQIFATKEDYYTKKEVELARNLLELQNEQKRFLAQQKQFYTIQKQLLAQNEKIATKQYLIARTQNEITNRQDTFNRLLKKLKITHIDNQHRTPFKFTMPASYQPLPVTTSRTTETTVEPTTPSTTSTTVESVKINLFSIPTFKKLVNQDEQMLKEKDYHTVDDLIYKFYFNNTFIDGLIKTSGILASIVGGPENKNRIRNAFIKRSKNEQLANRTLMIPIVGNRNLNPVQRHKRWIRRHPKQTEHKFYSKHSVSKEVHLSPTKVMLHNTGDINANKNDPFIKMARSFCKQIGQNENIQMLSWCVEKALRRLEYMDPTSALNKKKYTSEVKIETTKLTTPSTTEGWTEETPEFPSDPENPTKVATTPPNSRKKPTFFPDNDVIESKLKQYDMIPDTEGNVYYEGSFHASQMRDSYQDRSEAQDEDGVSDVLPGMNSDSRGELNPDALILQARRREAVRKMNESILKKISAGVFNLKDLQSKSANRDDVPTTTSAD